MAIRSEDRRAKLRNKWTEGWADGAAIGRGWTSSDATHGLRGKKSLDNRPVRLEASWKIGGPVHEDKDGIPVHYIKQPLTRQYETKPKLTDWNLVGYKTWNFLNKFKSSRCCLPRYQKLWVFVPKSSIISLMSISTSKNNFEKQTLKVSQNKWLEVGKELE